MDYRGYTIELATLLNQDKIWKIRTPEGYLLGERKKLSEAQDFIDKIEEEEE